MKKQKSRTAKPRELEEIRKDLEARGLWSIVEETARRHFLLPHELLGSDRLASVCMARFHLWSILRSRTGFSFPQLGRIFGRDHTTIMMGVRKYESQSGE